MQYFFYIDFKASLSFQAYINKSDLVIIITLGHC